ncbi:DUF1178 family protein [Crenalkalicoccus roseus]|uniref:DUF1178 family protein n=1 Tax=Crenalkalicoccus roseus TaxID=1485588 RepID=UPI00108158A4|nr:DUF1178 family protein [Crenalkalicoccus roseus]
MIRYDLRCSQDHEFDGWFKDSDAFDKLRKAGMVECPACGSTQVAKRLMAPAVVKAPGVKGRPERGQAPPPPAAVKPPAAPGPMPAQLVAALQRLRAEVERHCDYVGKDFAEEARRIHRGESERAGIYGETTEAEAEALEEEGIAFARIPWVPRAEG